MKDQKGALARPVVYNFKFLPDFFREMMKYKKSLRPNFSIRAATQRVKGCSPSLITQVLSGKRSLTRKQLPVFVKIFQLNNLEEEYIDGLLKAEAFDAEENEVKRQKYESKGPQNHILKDWVNIYVKDSCHLKSFKPEPRIVYSLIGGIVGLNRIERSINYHFEQGFRRKTRDKKIVIETPALTTTKDVSDKKIRQLHKQALKKKKKGIDKFSVEQRFASTVLVTVNTESQDKLRILVNRFQRELLQFIEENPNGDEALYQVNINMTPIKGLNDCK